MPANEISQYSVHPVFVHLTSEPYRSIQMVSLTQIARRAENLQVFQSGWAAFGKWRDMIDMSSPALRQIGSALDAGIPRLLQQLCPPCGWKSL